MGAESDHIRIRGARVHNLKDVDLDIPLRQLICFAGPSGSGKTSLAFHTLLAESRRRFVNSFPNSMKFFIDRPAAVDVDEIYPVLPVFGLPQTNPVMGSRSVVADVMRTTEVLQGLYFNYSKEYCPIHLEEVQPSSFSSQLQALSKNLKGEILYVLIDADLGAALFGTNFRPTRSWNSKTKAIKQFEESDDYWELLRFKKNSLANIDTKYADVIKNIEGRPLKIWDETSKKVVSFNYVSEKKCPVCDYSGTRNVRASSFSPHSALGACKACNGYGATLILDKNKLFNRDLSFNDDGVAFLKFGPLLWWKKELAKLMRKKKWPLDEPIGNLPKEFFKVAEEGEGSWPGFEDVQTYLNSKRYKPAVRVFIRKMQREETCQACGGSRIDSAVKNFLIQFGDKKYSLSEFSSLTLKEFTKVVASPVQLKETHAKKLIQELKDKSLLAERMGLGHLTLGRKTRTLSAGEYQRLLLLKYLSFNGTDSLFVLDEPSLGLGNKELSVLIQGLRDLINQGNTVLVIDHSEFLQKKSDYLVMMGPQAGHAGGEILFKGNPREYKFPSFQKTDLVKTFKTNRQEVIEVVRPMTYGIAWKDFKLPINSVTWVHGPSGSGKTSCIVNVLAQHIYKKIHKENLVDEPGTFKTIRGYKSISDVIVIDANINRFTSRSSVGSLTDLAPAVRKHFLKLPVCRAMGLKDGHLSRNSELGMCPKCEGRGQLVIEMQYLEDIVLECEECDGNGIKKQYAEISDGTMTVAESFRKPLSEVLPRIDLTPKFKRTWEYLKILNIDYLSLDRSINSLSGGEKQRIYLLSKLLKNVSEQLIIIENLSFGLSNEETVRISRFLQDLSQLGNTIVIIDSNEIFGNLFASQITF